MDDLQRVYSLLSNEETKAKHSGRVKSHYHAGRGVKHD